mmetsp:Transcript_37923/g.109389  ORF Transcript_37923/g.109389 Transcript_37923/m.109389 type:complete len:219 (-) Transcript_37923:69-725(-)
MEHNHPKAINQHAKQHVHNRPRHRPIEPLFSKPPPVSQAPHSDCIDKHIARGAAPCQEHSTAEHHRESRHSWNAYRLQSEGHSPQKHTACKVQVPGRRNSDSEAVRQDPDARRDERPQGSANREDCSDLGLVQAFRQVVEAHESSKACAPGELGKVDPSRVVLALAGLGTGGGGRIVAEHFTCRQGLKHPHRLLGVIPNRPPGTDYRWLFRQGLTRLL